MSVLDSKVLKLQHCYDSSFAKSSFVCDSGYQSQEILLKQCKTSRCGQQPAQQRQHPRRSSNATKTPSLVRQDERKLLFVNDLVESATNMVEVIWPLSSSPSATSCQSRGVLPLRRYIEETLRRSRTSYSTLQVALYYLILIKPHVPKIDFTMQQPSECSALRALQCGRRMFLTALILASKYLQDRNYSAKAWSKMSGLKVAEINTNERCFLQAVSWKLHIPDNIFKRWTDLVLKYTAPTAPTAPGSGLPVTDSKTAWKRIIPCLTPGLDDPRLPSSLLRDFAAVNDVAESEPEPIPETSISTASPIPEEIPTPTCSTPSPSAPAEGPPTPGLARLGPLPTPQLTPSSVASSTPAVSACSSRRPSMSMALAQAQNTQFCRSTIDRFPTLSLKTCTISRDSSLAPSVSSGSSPESMISDFSRSSRSSSISSVSTSLASAPINPCAARLATCRKSRLPTMLEAPKVLEGTSIQPIILDDVDCGASPYMASITIRDDSVTPVGGARPPPTSNPERRKRGRPSGEYNLVLQGKVRSLLSEGRVEAIDLTSDDAASDSSVSPCMLRQAFAALPSLSETKAVQPPCSLGRCGSNRLPICNETGRKRACVSTNASAHETPQQSSVLFMELTESPTVISIS